MSNRHDCCVHEVFKGSRRLTSAMLKACSCHMIKILQSLPVCVYRYFMHNSHMAICQHSASTVQSIPRLLVEVACSQAPQGTFVQIRAQKDNCLSRHESFCCLRLAKFFPGSKLLLVKHVLQAQI